MEQKMFIWCFGVWALPGSLHLFFSCLELTSQMRGAHKQTTKSKDPAA